MISEQEYKDIKPGDIIIYNHGEGEVVYADYCDNYFKVQTQREFERWPDRSGWIESFNISEIINPCKIDVNAIEQILDSFTEIL